MDEFLIVIARIVNTCSVERSLEYNEVKGATKVRKFNSPGGKIIIKYIVLLLVLIILSSLSISVEGYIHAGSSEP